MESANSSFLLLCMGALAVAAVITLEIIAAMAAKAAAILATGLAAKTLFAASVTAAMTFPAIIPIALLIIAVSAMCLLPFLFGRSYVISARTPSYGYYSSSCASPYPSYQPTFYHDHDHHHHNSSVYSSPVHQHGEVHQHGNTHGHTSK